MFRKIRRRYFQPKIVYTYPPAIEQLIIDNLRIISDGDPKKLFRCDEMQALLDAKLDR